MSKLIRLFIDGEWVESGARDVIPVLNPATEKTVAELCMANQDDLDHALAAAQRGFDIWRSTPASRRAQLLRNTAALMRDRVATIGAVLTQEQGKTLPQASGEILTTAAYFDELASCSTRVIGQLLPQEDSGVARSIIYEPIGPVFAISPWNLPAMMPGRKIATTLAAGCSIIVKPAKETPQTAYLIAQCCQDADIPDGVVNIVSGASSLISDTLIASPIIRKISFTGSTEVGKMLAQTAGSYMKKATMELGGHAPVIVFDDVEVESVVSMMVPSRYANAGQSCMAATRFFVHDSIYDNFVAAFTKKTAGLKLGNGLDDGIDMGPLTSERRLLVMERLVADAIQSGATLVHGGKRLQRPGYFFEPTILSEVPDQAKIMMEEPFGPITPIIRFDNIDDVVNRANSTPYGLASYIFSRDLNVAHYVASALHAGLVGVNTMNVAGPTVPFGGIGDSGIGREGAMEGLLESMTTKTISTVH